MITALSSHQRSYTCCLSFHHLLDALKLVSCWLPVTPPGPPRWTPPMYISESRCDLSSLSCFTLSTSSSFKLLFSFCVGILSLQVYSYICGCSVPYMSYLSLASFSLDVCPSKVSSTPMISSSMLTPRAQAPAQTSPVNLTTSRCSVVRQLQN